MTQARKIQISLDDSSWYHCVARCVRRAYLCGEDFQTGKSFEHRRGWIRDRLLELANIYAIDIAAYAVMSNHYHIVLHIDKARAEQWSDETVLERWTQLFTGPFLVKKFLSDQRLDMSPAELDKVSELVETYRNRLYDLSWFMRCLNESIAREANAEDGVKGRFWEGRFKSQVLLDEQALLAAMAYVDLNPIRAGMAQTPELSDYTSIQQRIELIQEVQKSTNIIAESAQECSQVSDDKREQADLMAFDATGRLSWAIPMGYEDYLELVDWTGRAIHPKKRGKISTATPVILSRLGFDGEAFIKYASRFLKEFGSAVGRPESLVKLSEKRQMKYLRGVRMAKKLMAAA